MSLSLAKAKNGRTDLVGILIIILILYFVGKALNLW